MSFLAFLKSLYRAHPHKHLHVIVDNLPLHKHSDVMEWVSRRRRLKLHFTPTYASWLNQIEIWFHIFSQDVVKGGVWRSKQELVDQINVRHQTIQPRQSPSLYLDLYRESACGIITLT